jgi:hypothetical protein
MQKAHLCGRQAEVADEKPLPRHALGKRLQKNQERVEKRRVAAGDEKHLHEACALVAEWPVVGPAHWPHAFDLAGVAPWQAQHVERDELRPQIGWISIEIIGPIKRRQMPVENIVKFLNFPDQVGGAIAPVVLDVERRLAARDRFHRAGDHRLLPAFNVYFDQMTGCKPQAIEGDGLDRLAARLAQLDSAECTRLRSR